MTAGRTGYSSAFLAALAVCIVLGAANLVMGNLNQDEGWYLYAAKSVAEGRLPYRDFAYTQGPMLPLVYGLATPVFDALGVAGGRALTWSLGLLSALLTAAAARRLGGRAAGVIAFVLVAVNVYQSYFTTVVKTYALCGFFMIAGFYALCRFVDSRRCGWLALGGVALAAAAGTRLSSGVLLPLVGLWLMFQPARWGRLGWLWFGLGGGVALIAIFLPLYLAAPEGFMFGLIEYHTMRESGSLLSSLVLKGGFVSRLVQFYFLAFLLLLALAAAKVLRPFKGQDTGYHQSNAFFLVRLMWLSVIAVSLVHIMAPFPYDDYQVPVFPVLAVALGVSWSYAVRAWSPEPFAWQSGIEPVDPPRMRWVIWVVLAASVASSFASPINMEWVVSGRDRIWWLMKDRPSLLLLRDVARDVRERCGSDVLLTQDTYLAVEAGKRVPAGWEMGPFSYYPDMSDERAATLHLLNRERLLEDLRSTPADMAAVSGYSLSIRSPEVVELDSDHRAEVETALTERFELTGEVPQFGQAHTVLKLYERRAPSGDIR